MSGAHGIVNAKTFPQNSRYGDGSLVMALINSGLDWIVQTVASWGNSRGSNGDVQFVEGPLLRIPADIIFFPSVITEVNSFSNLINVPVDTSPQAVTVEAFLQNFQSSLRGVFDQAYQAFNHSAANDIFRECLEICLKSASTQVIV